MIKVYDVVEIMEILKLNTPAIVYELFRTGELVGFRNHRQKWLCEEKDLIDYINRQKERAGNDKNEI